MTRPCRRFRAHPRPLRPLSAAENSRRRSWLFPRDDSCAGRIRRSGPIAASPSGARPPPEVAGELGSGLEQSPNGSALASAASSWPRSGATRSGGGAGARRITSAPTTRRARSPASRWPGRRIATPSARLHNAALANQAHQSRLPNEPGHPAGARRYAEALESLTRPLHSRPPARAWLIIARRRCCGGWPGAPEQSRASCGAPVHPI